MSVPHSDEIVWDAHDRIIERSERMKAGEWYDSSEERLYRSGRRIWTFTALLIVGILLLSGFLILKQTEPVRYVTQSYVLDGQVYQCTHGDDGSMDCHLESDENVGFGRMP